MQGYLRLSSAPLTPIPRVLNLYVARVRFFAENGLSVKLQVRGCLPDHSPLAHSPLALVLRCFTRTTRICILTAHVTTFVTSLLLSHIYRQDTS